MTLSDLPKLGLGLGLRHQHFDHILSTQPKVDWFEAISENFMNSGGRPRHVIRKIAERYPIVLHGVSMSIGSTDPLNMDYLQKLKALADEVQPKWISDHLCWTGVLGQNSHDLLPLPLTKEALAHVAARVHKVQEYLGRPLILENPSTYLTFRESEIAEPEFLKLLTDGTGCGLLLDVNNVYVSTFNAGTDPLEYIQAFPCDRVVQMHLAGHQNNGTHIIDTHDRPVLPAVWELFRLAWTKTHGASTLLEWDGNVPTFDICHSELLKARNYMRGAFDPSKMRPQSATSETAVANPVNFVAPAVMDNVAAS